MGRKSRARANAERNSWLWRRRGFSPPPPPPPATTVRIDGEAWELDGTPVPNDGTANFRTTAVSRPTHDVFVLRPSWGARVFGAVFTLFGGGILVAAVSVAATAWPRLPPLWTGDFFGAVFGPLVMAVLGGGALLMSLLLLTRTTRFDLATGRLTRREVWRMSWDRPVTDVLAVQSLYGGRVWASKGGSYHVFQVNLVMRTGARRTNLCTEPNEAYVRQVAADLAAFLGVPLADQLAATRPPG